MKVLVVDDSVSMRQMVSIILRSVGYETVEAVDGRDGINKFSSDIDVVIADYNMPNMSGIELTTALRQGSVNRSVPVLMLTTESEFNKKVEGKNAGATAWITKPFNKELLVNTIEKITSKVSF